MGQHHVTNRTFLLDSDPQKDIKATACKIQKNGDKFAKRSILLEGCYKLYQVIYSCVVLVVLLLDLTLAPGNGGSMQPGPCWGSSLIGRGTR